MELEDRALRRKILMEYKKRLLEAHKNQLDERLWSKAYHKRLFGGLFITAFTSMPTGNGNPDNNLETPCTIRVTKKEIQGT
jgi:hypothetical protein